MVLALIASLMLVMATACSALKEGSWEEYDRIMHPDQQPRQGGMTPQPEAGKQHVAADAGTSVPHTTKPSKAAAKTRDAAAAEDSGAMPEETERRDAAVKQVAGTGGKAGSDERTGSAEPGNTKETAHDIGVLNKYTSTRDEYVGLNDSSDFYRFEVERNGALTYSASKVSGSVRLQIFRDEAQLNLSNAYAQMDASESRDDAVNDINLAKGIYYARVVSTNNSSSLYTLNLSFAGYPYEEPDPPPGGDKASASKLGLLKGLMQWGGFVGRGIPEDYYEVEFDQNTNLTLAGNDLKGRSYITIALHEDADIINPQKFVTQFNVSTTNVTHPPAAVTAGKYYIRVVSANGYDSLYQLSLSVSD